MKETPTTLAGWLDWQQQLHPSAIAMGLDRVGRVAQALQLGRPAPAVVTVAGTNGKGSSVALMEQVLLAAGYRVAAYTSPHLLRYNERLRINAQDADDAQFCRAFAAVEAARGNEALTYFEFGTLAALWLMQTSNVDIALLEVGLGGRLDAVNIIDADVSLITNIGLDHRDWLGDTREAIGREKAGIMRAGRPAVCGDRNPPASLRQVAADKAAQLQCLGVDFDLQILPDGCHWHWSNADEQLSNLPMPALRGAHQLENAAAAIATLKALRLPTALPLDAYALGLRRLQLAGRLQCIELAAGGKMLLDVAHNAEGSAVLQRYLAEHPVPGKTRAVFAALRDKPVLEMTTLLAHEVDAWFFAGLPELARGLSAAELAQALAQGPPGRYHAEVAMALHDAVAVTQAGDRLLVYGSFHTVAAALEWQARVTAG